MTTRLTTLAGLFALVVALVVLSPTLALAAEPTAPVLTPAPIVLEDFESATSTRYTVSRWDLLNPSTAWWGRRSASGSYRNGLWGLWCAGTGGTWPNYPIGSSGWAFFSLPESSDYYSVYADFWYRMPSLGAADANSFVVGWYTSALSNYPKTVYGFPKTSSWTRLVLDMSQPVDPGSHDRGGNLSRASGTVRLQFVDFAEGPTQSPAVGTGPSVDDFAITGWKYGPPRGVASQVSPNQVVLTWQRPYRATGSTTLEERTIGYRVFRTLKGTSNWTQITSALVPDNGTSGTFTDSTVAGATAYTYAVQAFDASGGYGMPVTLDVISHDTVPPTTSIGGVPAGWSTTNVSVTLTGVDQVYGAGVAATYYKLNGGGQITYPGSPFTISSEGTTTVEYWSVDKAVPANTELPHKTAVVRVDKLPPTTPGQPTASNITTTSVTLSWTASTDAGSGVKGYDVYDGTTKVVSQTPGTSVTIGGLAPDSTHSYTIVAIDNVNRASPASPARVVTTLPAGGGDTTPPVTTASLVPAGWTQSDVTVTLTRNEPGTTYYKLPGGGQVTYSAPFTITAEGTTAIEYWSVDTAGNPETHRFAYAYIDRTDPVTTVSGIPAGWSAVNVTVTFSATDNSGVSPTVYYKVGAGATTPGGSVTISAEGQTSVEYWSVDAAGNEEGPPHKFATVRIDKNPPTVPGQPSASGQTASSVTLSWAGSTDAGSGVKGYNVYDGATKMVSLNPGTSVTLTGLATTTYSFSVTAVDNTDKESAQSPARTVTLTSGGGGGGGGGGGTPPPPPPDTTPPATSISGVPASWTNSNVTITLTRNEAGATYYRLGGGAQQTYTSPVTVSAEGQTALEFWSVDTAGNTEAHQSRTVMIDKGAPGISTDAKASYEGTAVINIAATDARSGVKSIEHRLDSGAWASGTRLTTTAKGAHTLSYRATDFAGNTASGSVAFTVNGAAPPEKDVATTLIAAFAQTSRATYVTSYNGLATIQGDLARANPGSAVASKTVVLEYSYDGKRFSRYGRAPEELSPGRFSIDVRAARRTWFRLRFAGAGAYLPSLSRTLDVRPRADLTPPSVPEAMSRARSYSVYGYLKPRHSGNAVRVYAYRREKVGGSWRWVHRVIVYARAYNYSSYSRYIASVRLPYAGTWAVRAYHYDSAHYPTYSSWRYVKVR